MDLGFLNEFTALLLAVSLATERLIVLVRNLASTLGFKFLNEENTDERKESVRKLIVYLVSFICACFTAGFLTDINGEGWCIFDSIQIRFGESSREVHLLLIALFATGGSSFWKNFNGYTKAVRDLRKEEKKKLFNK